MKKWSEVRQKMLDRMKPEERALHERLFAEAIEEYKRMDTK